MALTELPSPYTAYWVGNLYFVCLGALGLYLAEFIASSQRGICRPRRNAGQEGEDDLG